MADSAIRPAQQLLQQVFSETQRKTYGTLQRYIDEGGSIFPLVEMGVSGLVGKYQMSAEDAQRWLRGANSLAIYVRRQFIEHSLHGSDLSVKPASGLLSMVEGPSYESLFKPLFDRLCPPDALESVTSPVAYLIELFRLIGDIENKGVGNVELHTRRADLKDLSVDFNAVHQPVSSVDIIVSVLETFIQEHGDANDDGDLETQLINARYPNGLPYYQHWATLDTVTRFHDLSVGNFVHRVDSAYPYFLQPKARGENAGRGMAHASRLGPYQRALLTELFIADTSAPAFYLNNFGASPAESLILSRVALLGERTKLDARQIEALLSVRDFAPTRSANVPYPPAAQEDDKVSGSVYINAQSTVPITINFSGVADAFHELSAPTSIVNPYDRINRKVRLDQWLELPTEQTDALLAAAIRAENRTTPAHSWRITEPVVHAFGIFQTFRDRYGCNAADFAAFIDQLGIYGRGETLSQFDQVFNSQGGYGESLKLDNGTFAISPAPGSPDLTARQLCHGLQIDPQTYEYLARAVGGARGVTTNLTRDAQTVSSFYRLVKLPRLLGITPIEGVLMLLSLGGNTWLNGLAGETRINSATDSESPPDVLDLMYAMHSCVAWCRERELPVQWVLQQVALTEAVVVHTAKEQQLSEQIHNLLPTAQLTNAAFVMAGESNFMRPDWLNLLANLVDPEGLVLPFQGTEPEYLVTARTHLDNAVRDGLKESDEAVRAPIVESMLAVLLQFRDAQVSVAKECLAVYSQLDAERALQVLFWVKGTVYQLLRQVLERREQNLGDPATKPQQSDPLLKLLAELQRRSALVAKLDLSASVLEDYLYYGHLGWLGQADKHVLTLKTLYGLTVLTKAFESSEQPQSKLLDYLRQVNALPPGLAGNALDLAQRAAAVRLAAFFDWSVQEVRECTSRIDPSQKLLKNLTQLDLLMRIRTLARQTGMDALTIFLLGDLPDGIDTARYSAAAERALLSLSAKTAAVVSFADETPEQIVVVTCLADKTKVVANKNGKSTDVIVFTVTLKKPDGSAWSGIKVYWESTLGTVETGETDIKGVLLATYRPGPVMGSETPLFRLDLFEFEHASSIDLIADYSSLSFPPALRSRVPSGTVPAGQEVELYATLIDQFGNLGKNSLVDWLTEPNTSTLAGPVIRPAQGLTDQHGVTRVFISSATAGKFTFSVLSHAGEKNADFPGVTFAGNPTDVRPAGRTLSVQEQR